MTLITDSPGDHAEGGLRLSVDDETCMVCDGWVRPLASARVLKKYDVQYLRCCRCGFVQTESPYWLQEAYAAPIARQDIGLIGRNIALCQRTCALIPVLLDANSRFVDYGGGNGMFVRLMRDAGFDFYWRDPYSTNLFAEGFEADSSSEYELVTAFEVFEHLREPVLGVRDMNRYSGNILFSTLLMQERAPRPEEWWYYALDTGQHISLFTLRALNILGERTGMHLVSNGIDLHMLSRAEVSPRLFRFVTHPRISHLLRRRLRRKSLLGRDYQTLTGNTLQ